MLALPVLALLLVYSQAMKKLCRGCGLVLGWELFYDRNKGVGPLRLESRCRDCEAARSSARQQSPEAKQRNREYQRQTRKSPLQARIANLKHMFRLTPEDYRAILEQQGGMCAICGVPEPQPFGFGVDHDHTCCFEKNASGSYKRTCGRCVRGLLCQPCNAGLGLWRDDKARLYAAIAYLDNWSARG